MKVSTYHPATRPLVKFTQLLLIDESGYVQDSCNSVFMTDTLLVQPIVAWMPFMESVYPLLQKLSPDDDALRFAKIEKPAPFLSGFYDFTFSKLILENQTYILWCIFDYTYLYTKLRFYQQQYNELEIARQQFELGNRQVKSRVELRERLSDFEEKIAQTNFFETLQYALDFDNDLDAFERQFLFHNQLDVGRMMDAFNTIKKDCELFYTQSINEKTTPSQLIQLFKQVREALIHKMGYPVKMDIHATPLAESYHLQHPIRTKQILFNLLVLFYEEYIDSGLYVTFTQKETTSDTLTISICEYDAPLQKKAPLSVPVLLTVRLALIRRMVEELSGHIDVSPQRERFCVKLSLPRKIPNTK